MFGRIASVMLLGHIVSNFRQELYTGFYFFRLDGRKSEPEPSAMLVRVREMNTARLNEDALFCGALAKFLDDFDFENL